MKLKEETAEIRDDEKRNWVEIEPNDEVTVYIERGNGKIFGEPTYFKKIGATHLEFVTDSGAKVKLRKGDSCNALVQNWGRYNMAPRMKVSVTPFSDINNIELYNIKDFIGRNKG